MLFDLDNQYIKSHLGEAEFGIERESLRVTSSGALAQTKHPFGEHKNIDRDFCENQVEIIGDVFNTPEELIGKTLVAITNLPPRKMMGRESCGMLLSAVHTEKGEEKLNLIMLNDAIPAGAKLC